VTTDTSGQGPAANENHFERDDDRWQHRRSRRDWLILLGMIVVYLTWTGLIVLLEPGIR
jgi:hypothetical protein